MTRYSLGNFSGNGPHAIMIHKITENHYFIFGSSKPSIFRGIILQGSNITIISNHFTRKRKIEFFSDSNSNGFGIDSQGTTVECLLHLRDCSNCYQGRKKKLL